MWQPPRTTAVRARCGSPPSSASCSAPRSPPRCGRGGRTGGRVTTPTAVQLLIYRFGAGAGFEGHLVGALERIEAGGALKILDLLLVGSDAATGERFAIDMPHGGAAGIVAPLLSFRLDIAE